MSRSYFNAEPGRWRMFCDVCFDHDDETFDTAPELLPFHRGGWFIGTHLDACPACVKAGRLPNCGPNPKVIADAAAEVTL